MTADAVSGASENSTTLNINKKIADSYNWNMNFQDKIKSKIVY